MGTKSRGFGGCLGKLLRDKQWSVQALANELDVERSLVYKWLRGDRTPQLISNYVARIAAILSLTPEERADLESGQVWSLSAPRPPRPPKQPGSQNVQRLLSVRPKPLAASKESVEGEGLRLPNRRNVIRSGVIHGRVEALQAMLSLIDAAPAPVDPLDETASTICLTSVEGSSWNEHERSEYLQTWCVVISRAMARGWRFCHLVRLDKNTDRTLAMARLMLDLMGTGQYTALCSYASQLVLPAVELLVIPGIAAVQYFATQTMTSVDAALILKKREEVALAHAYFQRAAAGAKPLVRAFLPDDWVAFASSRVEAEEQYGGHVLVKDGLSQLSEPPEWADRDAQWVRHSRYGGEKLSALIDTRKRQLAAFEAHVKRHTYREICPMRAVKRLMQMGHYLQDSDVDFFVEPVADRIAHLEHVIALLRAHEHYELALVDVEQEDEIPVLTNRYWEVIGGMRVFTNLHVPDSRSINFHSGIVIAEPSLVGAFQSYFDDLWERVALRDKDKGFVIWWLERQLDSVR
jgi:transcriptional regulator with XRE-family HTH domain